jgi:hypothetical protein
MTLAIKGIRIPDSKLAGEATELVRDTESPPLFHHSSRVYYWGALTGKRHGLRFDRELLYAGAMFHDMGLTPAHASAHERFEVDGANVARDFLRSHGSKTSRRSGPRSRCTRRQASRSTCIPSSRSSLLASRWTCSALRFPSSPTLSAKPSSTHTRPPSSRFKEEIIQAFCDASVPDPRRPLAMSKPMYSPTRIPPSGPRISAA